MGTTGTERQSLQEEILALYADLVAEVDRLCRSIHEAHRPHLQCAPGCTSCCQRRLTVLRLEADLLEEAVAALSWDEVASLRVVGGKGCPLLVDGVCAVYESRPVLCRTHGYPVTVRGDQDQLLTSWCELNFTTVPKGYVLPAEHNLDLDRINEVLVSLNSTYLGRHHTDPQQARTGMLEVARQGLERKLGGWPPTG